MGALGGPPRDGRRGTAGGGAGVALALQQGGCAIEDSR